MNKLNLKKFFFLCLFFYLVFSQSYEYPPHGEIYSHNYALVSSGPFTRQQPPWLRFEQPSLSNPFHYTFFKFTSLYPSVSNRTSANKLESFFWIWGEDHPEYYTIYLTPNECGTPYVSFRAVSNATLDGLLNINLDTISKSYSFNGSSPDPFPLKFSNTELSTIKTRAEEKEAVLPKLELEFSGAVSINYSVFEVHYIVIKTKEGVKCESFTRIYLKNFKRSVADKIIYDVEHSQPLFYLLQPIDNEQLSFSPQAKFVFLTNYHANKIWIKSDNFLASNIFASYYVEKDPFSFKNIYRKEFLPPLAEKKIFSNSTFKFLNSSFFITKDHNFAHQYYTHVFLPYLLGNKNFLFYILDEFNQVSTFQKELEFKSGSGARILFSDNQIIQTDKNASFPKPSISNNSIILKRSEQSRGAYYSFFDSIKFILTFDEFLSLFFVLGLVSVSIWWLKN